MATLTRAPVTTRARETGRLVTVCHVDDLGLSVDDGGPWVTYCEDHGLFVQHRTWSLARAWASAPPTRGADCAAGRPSDPTRDLSCDGPTVSHLLQ